MEAFDIFSDKIWVFGHFFAIGITVDSKEIKCWYNVCMSCLNLCTICFLKKSYQSIIRNIIHNSARFVLWIMFLGWKYVFVLVWIIFVILLRKNKSTDLRWDYKVQTQLQLYYHLVMLVFDELALIYSLSFILQSAKLTSNFLF